MNIKLKSQSLGGIFNDYILLNKTCGATYQPVDERKFIGHGRDLALLTINGNEGDEVDDNKLFCRS